MDINTIKNKTKNTIDDDKIRQLPFAIRMFSSPESNKFDKYYTNRPTNTFLTRFTTVKYPVTDRQFGNANEPICNIFLNQLNQPAINNIIEEYLDAKKWVYHPVRSFEKWHNISKLYYDEEKHFWVILLFNRITDPFKSLQDFNMIRVPSLDIISRIEYRYQFDFSNATDIKI